MRVNRNAFNRIAMKLDRGQGPLLVTDLHDIFGAESIQHLLTKGAAPAHCHKCGVALPEHKPRQLAGGYTVTLCEDCHNLWIEVAQVDPRALTFIQVTRQYQAAIQTGREVDERLEQKALRASGAMFKFGRDFCRTRPKTAEPAGRPAKALKGS